MFFSEINVIFVVVLLCQETNNSNATESQNQKSKSEKSVNNIILEDQGEGYFTLFFHPHKQMNYSIEKCIQIWINCSDQEKEP